MSQSFVVVDLETTGLSPDKHHIIEIGAMKVKEGKVVDTYSELLYPGYPLPPMITEITHITDTMLVGKPSFGKVAQSFYEFLEELPLLGHNVAFDYRFLKVNFERLGIAYERKLIDTLTIAKELHGELESRSLENMCGYYNLHNESAHRAFEDVKVTYQLYNRMRDYARDKGMDVEQLCGEKPYFYKVKKEEPMTGRQKNYLIDLVKYHKIDTIQTDGLTKRQASRLIDKIISEYGRRK